jgi:hypothetical protein
MIDEVLRTVDLHRALVHLLPVDDEALLDRAADVEPHLAVARVATDHTRGWAILHAELTDGMWNLLDYLGTLQQHHRHAVLLPDNDLAFVVLKPNAANIVDASDVRPKLALRLIFEFRFHNQSLVVRAEGALHLRRVTTLEQRGASLTDPRLALRE